MRCTRSLCSQKDLGSATAETLPLGGVHGAFILLSRLAHPLTTFSSNLERKHFDDKGQVNHSNLQQGGPTLVYQKHAQIHLCLHKWFFLGVIDIAPLLIEESE